jgi:hypothetical protein
MKDIFEHPELMPAELRQVMEKWEAKMLDGFTYTEIAEMLKEVEAVGYTFEYYLDAEPYGLRPIGTPLNQLEGFENCNL